MIASSGDHQPDRLPGGSVARSRFAMRDTWIVVPCFDEENRLQPDKFRQFSRSSESVQLLFVDDGSEDNTARILEDIAAADPTGVAVAAFDENRGKSEAVRQGMLTAFKAGARFAGYWDADLATPLDVLADFRKILEDRPETDIVLGSRVKLMGREVRRNELRHYLGRVFATGASLTLKLPVYDTQCGAKLFRSNPILRRVFATPFRTRWIFDVEILARYLLLRQHEPEHRTHDRIYELVLPRWTDVSGSKIRVRDWIRAPVELATIWWHYGRRL